MRVLVGCEFSQIVTRAFREKGHEAFSCDVLPTEGNPDWHIQGDILDVIDQDWDLAIFHPPCTYLTCAGNKWFGPKYQDRFPNRKHQMLDAAEFFLKLTKTKIPKWAIENPIGRMSSLYRKPDQIIQPFQFGHDVRKSTCLWLHNLPLLRPTEHVDVPLHITKNGNIMSKWHVETGKLSSKDRSRIRSITFAGIATAMADQWSNLP